MIVDEMVVRLVVVVVIGLAALALSVVARRGIAVRRTGFAPRGLATGIHLFSSKSCSSCERARAVLAASGHPFEEHSYETASELHIDNGIERVPAIAWVPGSGTDRPAWIASGVPTGRTLQRWLGP